LLAAIRPFFIAILFTSLLSACSDGPGPVPEAMPGLRVTTLRVQSQLNTSTIELYGQLVAENPALIKPLIDGARIESVLVEEGQSVVAGQALVKLDTRSLMSEQQQQRQVRIRLQSLALSSASQLQQSESKLLQSLDELKRYREVADSGAISKLDLVAREQAYAQARAERDAAMRNLGASQAELKHWRHSQMNASRTASFVPRLPVLLAHDAPKLAQLQTLPMTRYLFWQHKKIVNLKPMLMLQYCSS
jgi:HlyD family secretion protein